MKTTRVLSALCTLLLLCGCIMPLAEAPRSIVVKEEIVVKYKGVLSSRVQEARIKPGEYPFSHHNFACFYFSGNGDVVSYSPNGEPPRFLAGGIGMYRETKDIFLWQWLKPAAEIPGFGVQLDQSKKVEGAVAIIPKEQLGLIQIK